MVTSVPAAGAGAAVGALVAPRLARGFHVSLERGRSRPRGLGTFDDVTGAGRGRKMPPEAPISSETFLRGLGGMEFVVRAVGD
jgi:hypothetical protein